MVTLFLYEPIIAIFLILPVLYIIHTASFPSLPGPGLLEYLPGGIIFPLWTNSAIFSRIMVKLGKAYGDIFSLWLGPAHVIVTSIPADVVQIMHAVDDFERPREIMAVFEAVAPGGVFSMPVGPHRRIKKVLRSRFNHTMLKGFHTHMTEAIEELCECIHTAVDQGSEPGSSDVVDISEITSLTTFRVITNVAFGSNMTKQERLDFSEAMTKIMPEMMKDYVGYPVRQALTMFGTRKKLLHYKAKIKETCDSFIEKRQAETEEQRNARETDMLDTILSIKEHPMDVIRSIAAEFGVGGSHTSNQMLSWCLFETCCNPRVIIKIELELEAVLGDRPGNDPMSFEDLGKLPYMMKVWKETCRMHPMGPFLNRITTKDLTLKGSGVRVTKGTNVLAFYQKCQMDPTIWKDPHKFKPERWGTGTERREGDLVPPGAFVPFGIGTFSCPGRFLADYEGPLMLAEMHRRFKFTLACRPDEVQSCTAFVESPRYINKAKNIDMGLPLRIERRV